jgi:hypothetical protein
MDKEEHYIISKYLSSICTKYGTRVKTKLFYLELKLERKKVPDFMEFLQTLRRIKSVCLHLTTYKLNKDDDL